METMPNPYVGLVLRHDAVEVVQLARGLGGMKAEHVMVRGSASRGKSFSRGIHSPQCVGGSMTWCVRRDSNRWSGVCLPGRTHSHAPGDGGADPAASFNGDGDRLFDGAFAVDSVGQGSIGFQNQPQGFFQIPLGFSQRPSLGIDAGNFLHVADVPRAVFHVDCGKLSNHRILSVAEDDTAVNGRGQAVSHG